MKKLNAAKVFILCMSLCLLTACGNASAGQKNDGGNEAAGMEGTGGNQTSGGANGSADAAAGQLAWQDKKGIWQFDTSQFDASKFSGMLHIDGKEISLPMTVSSLLEQGIYVYEAVDGTLESSLSDMQKKTFEFESYDNGGWVYHDEGGTMESLKGIHQITVWNPLQETVTMEKCAVGTMMFEPKKDGVCIMGFKEPEESPYRLSLEEVVEFLGAPCYYFSNNSGGHLHYYYGDYSLEFGFGSGGTISYCTYITTAYGESPLYKATENWEKYKAVYEQLK